VLPDLTDPIVRGQLDRAIELADGVTETDPVRRAAKVRALVEAELAGTHLPGAELATEALAQSELRKRAADKFGELAVRLFLTPSGLEQATRHEVADHRAHRFAAAGVRSVLDLCCGVGADLLAFHRAGLVVAGVDADPQTAQIAAANLAAVGCTGSVSCGMAEQTPWATAESVFLDPARRTDRGRTFDPAGYSPPFGFVAEVLAAAGHAAAKVAPGLDHALVPTGVEAEWVSFRGGVKEAVLWGPGFTEVGVRRRATVLSPTVHSVARQAAGARSSQLTDRDPSTSEVRQLGAFLYEPDGAVIRAGLVQQAATVLSGWRIDEHLAYLSADAAVATPLAKGYRVAEILPYSVKRLRAALARREVGIVEIKKRGVDIDPAALRRELAPKGSNSCTVLLARVGDQRLAVIAQPL
jgi:predicted HAD superfamily Cof-like phosphohydrolase